MESIHIIGAGMAGCEAAWQAANMGVPTVLYEMRPETKSLAHQGGKLAELVCSNSFRSADHEHNAVGLLHWEMEKAAGLIISAGQTNSVPAGSALAVNREHFSDHVTEKITNHPLITVERKEIICLDNINWKNIIIATGPLTSDKFSNQIIKLTGQTNLAFFDAISPIVYAESIDMSKVWFQSRYDKGKTESEKKAYLNCPLNKEEYYELISGLISAEKTEFHQWEKETPYFDGCLPIEVMAQRGLETLRFGPMKPVGLTNPHDSSNKPYAVVQLRMENREGTLLNIVGFQTKIKYSEQVNLLRKIPGLENASFARLGGIHRNTFINSPRVLNSKLQLKSSPNIRFAGQITGVEGYVESAAIGLIAGKLTASDILGKNLSLPGPTTAIGSLLNHITQSTGNKNFQPMNVNFGLFTPLTLAESGRKNRKIRYKKYTDRAKSDWLEWLKNI